MKVFCTSLLIPFFLLSSFLIFAQRKPLPTSFWEEKVIHQNCIEGTYNRNVSAEAELVSLYGAFEMLDQTSEQSLKVAFYLPKDNQQHLILAEEKMVLEYYRMEGSLTNAKKGNWNELSTWSKKLIREKKINLTNLGVLVYLGMKNMAEFYAPALVYQKAAPKEIEAYFASIRIGTDIKGGSYKVYRGAKLVDEGKIGGKLGGALANIRIPLSKIGNTAGEIKTVVKLQEENGDQPELIFYFYHFPWK